MKKNRMACILSLMMIISSIFVSPIYASDEQKIKERELNEVNQKIKEIDAQIDANMNLQNTVASNMRQTEQNIKGIENDIAYLNKEIDIALGNIAIKEEAIDLTSEHLSHKTKILNKRLRAMYKVGEVGYLEVLLGSEDFEDLLTRLDMVQTLVNYDQTLISELDTLKKRTMEQKVALDMEKSNFESKKTEKQNAQNQLELKYSELKAYKAQLVNEKAAMKELEDEFLKEANKLTSIIENLKLQAQYAGGSMSWPAPGYSHISSYFGSRVHPIYGTVNMHTGIDIPMDYGADVLAANSGVVIYSDWYGGYGKLVMIDHGGGIVTLYAHNSSTVAKVGERVNRGQVIAKAGSTGDSTGVHCHFEIRKDGKYTDPMPYLNGNQ